jgi:hypothetical protein
MESIATDLELSSGGCENRRVCNTVLLTPAIGTARTAVFGVLNDDPRPLPIQNLIN